jgi:hypothetical protein
MEKLTAVLGLILAISVGLMVLFPCIYAEEGILDNDGDGIPDDLDMDDDNDGVPDMEELVYGTDPFDPNSYPVIEEML